MSPSAHSTEASPPRHLTSAGRLTIMSHAPILGTSQQHQRSVSPASPVHSCPVPQHSLYTMGLFRSPPPSPKPLPNLTPVSPPFEVVRGYTREHQTTLVLNKKILTFREVRLSTGGAEAGLERGHRHRWAPGGTRHGPRVLDVKLQELVLNGTCVRGG